MLADRVRRRHSLVFSTTVARPSTNQDDEGGRNARSPYRQWLSSSSNITNTKSPTSTHHTHSGRFADHGAPSRAAWQSKWAAL
jgi:hypothetical protein